MTYAADVDAASRSEIEELLAGWDKELFPGRQIEISVLVGGASNRNFTVSAPPAKYALRISNEQSERFAVDRVAAVQAQREAAAAGLAPAVLAEKSPEGHVLSTFVEGETLGAERVRQPEVLETVGATLRELHSLPTSLPAYSPFEEIRLWAGLARSDGTEAPDGFDGLLAAVCRIEELMRGIEMPTVFCHNDPYPPNFILSGSRLSLVDWDYAGRGWAFFELGSFSVTADLDPPLRDVLLRSYDPQTSEADRARVELFGFVAAMREATWAVMATPILRGTTTPATGGDFYDIHLRTYLGEARKRAGAAGFAELMKVAAGPGGPGSR